MHQLIKDIKDITDFAHEELISANANKNAEVFFTQRDLIAGEVAKYIAYNEYLPRHIVDAHKDGLIHFHDLDYMPLMPMTNCALINLKDMLDNGFRLGQVKIERPRGIHTAMTVASQVVMACGSSQYGGISFDRFDEILSPYALTSFAKYIEEGSEKFNLEGSSLIYYAETKLEDEIKDACQTFEYQVNTMTCTTGQTPFLTIGFGLGVDKFSKLIQKHILQTRLNGLGKDKVTAIFPKLVYSIKDGVNHKPEDCNYDIKQLALKCSAKRLYPDILNYDQVVEKTGSFKTSMGCRSFLSQWTNDYGKDQSAGRTNLGVQTINLPMIGMEAGKDFDKFWKILDDRINLAFECCDIRLKRLRDVQAKNAPILYMEGGLLRLGAEEFVLPHLLKRGSSISIGYIGLNELANAMYGDEVHLFDCPEKKTFTLEVLKYINDKVQAKKEETGIGYSTYATPSESQCHRLLKSVRDKFGVVKGVTDKEYFTNSFHLEASKQTDVYSRMDFEAQYIPYSTGGFISYGEYPDMNNNIEALENAWDYSYYTTPYYAINCPSDKCFECGHEGSMEMLSRGYRCPKCGNGDSKKMYVIRRVSGYLGNPSERPFNKGKHEETRDRVNNLK